MPDQSASSRYLAYEGFPLESVLARVSADHGAAATITSAERIRKGGVKGFFARELFQVIVDIGSSDPNAQPNYDPSSEIDPEDIPGALALGGGSELDLDLVEADRFDLGTTGVVSVPSVDSVDIEETDDELWALLARAARGDRSSIAEPTPVTEPDIRLDAVAPPAPEWQQRGEPRAFPVPSLPPMPAPVFAPFVSEAVSSEAIAAELVQPLKSLGPIASTTVIPGVRAAQDAVAVADPFQRQGAAAVPHSDEVVAHALAAFRSSEAMATPVAPEPVDLATLLADLDETLPLVPPIPSHGVIVIVGDRDEAVESARSIAVRLGLRHEDVLVASPGALPSIPTAAELAMISRAARDKATPQCVVAVELVPGRDGHEWTRAVIGGIGADQIRFAADAERYVAHQHFSVAAIGGAHVADLRSVSSIEDPTTALALGLPVGTIDGRPATTELWAAAMLASRSPRQPIAALRSVEDK